MKLGIFFFIHRAWMVNLDLIIRLWLDVQEDRLLLDFEWNF